MTVKCRKKFQSMGWPWLSLREMHLMSEVSDVFSSLDSEKIQFIFVCLFPCHCPMDTLVCSGRYCIFEYPTHICLFVSPSLSPVHLLVCSVGTSVWVVRWPSTAGGWRLRVCIFAKWKRAPKKRNQVKRGKKYGLLGTHFHFPWTFTLSLFQLCKAFLCF